MGCTWQVCHMKSGITERISVFLESLEYYYFFDKSIIGILYLLDLCLMWCLWKERNKKSFEDHENWLLEMKKTMLQSPYIWRVACNNLPVFNFSEFLELLLLFLGVLLYTPCVLQLCLFALWMNVNYLSKNIYTYLVGQPFYEWAGMTWKDTILSLPWRVWQQVNCVKDGMKESTAKLLDYIHDYALLKLKILCAWV